MFCTKCGTQGGEADQFCRKCGLALENSSGGPATPATTAKTKKKSTLPPSFVIVLLAIIVVGTIINSISSSSNSSNSGGTNGANEKVAVPQPTPDNLSSQAHLAELKKLVGKHPLQPNDAEAIERHIKQLQLKKADSVRSTADLIKRAQSRVDWVKVRGDVDIDAVVACESATESMLKAPDEVEWKDHQEEYDPDKDWIYKVDLQANAMNSFGAKLRTTFYCSALCSDKPGINGIRCLAINVKERE